MEEKTTASTGFITTLGRLGSSLLISLQTRVDLFSLELKEEKYRLIETFIWLSAALFFAAMTTTLASISLVIFFWEQTRLGVLLGLTLVHAIAFLGLALRFRRFLANQPEPMAATRTELHLDLACIRKTS